MDDSGGISASARLRGLLGAERIVSVLRAPRPNSVEPVVEVLARSGVRTIELTLTSPGVLDELPSLRERFGAACIWGVGTILSASLARDAIAAGAEFLVTPMLLPEVIAVAREHGVPILSGALTPTEIRQTYALGADCVKLFPASLGGPQYLRELRGPFPNLGVMPSGGVGIADTPAWLAAGALAVSLGGSLIGDAFEGDLHGLRQRADIALAATRREQPA